MIYDLTQLHENLNLIFVKGKIYYPVLKFSYELMSYVIFLTLYYIVSSARNRRIFSK